MNMREALGARVGVSLPHESAHLHVAGSAPYVDDLPELAGTLHAALGLAPIAHGRITGFDRASIEAMLRDLGFDPELATRRAEDLAAAQTRHGKTHATAAPDATLRSLWQQEARELGVDPDQVAADVGGRWRVDDGRLLTHLRHPWEFPDHRARDS